MWAKIKAWFYRLIGRKPKVDEVFGIEIKNSSGGTTLTLDSETKFIGSPFDIPVYLPRASVKTIDLSAYGQNVLIHDFSGWPAAVTVDTTGKKVTITAVGQYPTTITLRGVGLL